MPHSAKRRTRLVVLSALVQAALVVGLVLAPSPSLEKKLADATPEATHAAEKQATADEADAGLAMDEASRRMLAREAAEFGLIGLTANAPLATWGSESSDARGMTAGAGTLAASSSGPGAFRAGEWDDNANYREFQNYLARPYQGFHAVDISDRMFLVVRDAHGRAVPSCLVTVVDAQGRRLHLRTTASGRALLFPHAEGMGTGAFTASAKCAGSEASVSATTTASDPVVRLDLATVRQLPEMRQVEIAFVLDTTGSMSEELAAVKATIRKVTASLASGQTHVRVGLVEYKDRNDRLTTRVLPMTSDLAGFADSVALLTADGGGDTEESVNEGLHVALRDLAWTYDATVRMAFLIGDAPPHLDYAHDFDYAVEMRNAAHAGIPIFTIAASGMDTLGQTVWRQIAQYTGATNMFVLRGGKDSPHAGAGDPRASCGGTQTAYVSANLDTLIVRKITQELAAVDADPTRIAGVFKDEITSACGNRYAGR